MSFDGMFTHAMVNELTNTLLNGRVNKISQPYPNEIVLTIRAQRKNYPLLLSAHPTYARVQITEVPFINPPVPTNFTMMLRKYLEGAKLISIEQVANDRIINFHFQTRNELGDQLPLVLSVELMGRYSNVILINQAEQRIIDTIKHIGLEQNRVRTLLPGSTYQLPPAQGKLDPFTDETKQYQALVKEFPNREVLAKALMNTYQGLAFDSSLVLADILHQSVDVDANFNHFLAETNDPTPLLFEDQKGKLQFSLYQEVQGAERVTYPTLSSLLDAFYQEKAERSRVHQLGAILINTIKNELSKNKKKLKKLENELQAAENAQEFQIKGELLTTYLFQIERGMTEITLPNYYDNENPLTIALSNQLSPSQNAQKYFKKYQKAKNAQIFVTEQIEETTAEIAYLEEVQSQIELASPKDLAEIYTELQQEGYLRQRKVLKKQKRPKINKPEAFTASDGTTILVGKNNLQNDQLTLKSARKSDIWLHVKNLPGSHVVIESNDPSEETIYEAAMLAAYFSKGRTSALVPVDYVPIKNIHKPNGAKPGYVIYEGQKTINVTPTKDMVEKLKA